jgi:hypothetical protein
MSEQTLQIASFSTGLSSAVIVERMFARYDPADVRIVFMDTLIEDDDNYRFLADMGARWLALYGAEIVYLRRGFTPYEVAKTAQIIPNQKIAPCTDELKIGMFTEYLRGLDPGLGKNVNIGYDFTEVHRCGPTEKNYHAQGWACDFPLLWKPYEFRKYKDIARHDWGIEPPRMYVLGYTHANCGGRCVKQGIGDWLRTLINFPERYQEAELWEQEMRQHPKRKDYALLRDQSGDTVKALTLLELRQRHEAGQMKQPALYDFHAGCIHCGVGDLA